MERQLRHHARHFVLLLSPVGLALITSACATSAYLRQATMGQMELINRARPLEEVIQSPKTSNELKALLKEVPKIKAFGEKRGLKRTTNYTEFVDLHRPWVTLLLTASPELEFNAKTWSFPVVGTVSYLGFFDEAMAKRERAKLQAEGMDVDLREVGAYSTLGWFKDPLLSSMLPDKHEELGDLVNVVLHETVHATLYIKNESLLNENIASFVGDRLTERYLRETYGEGSPEEKQYYLLEKTGKARRTQLLKVASDLRTVYANTNLSDERKRAEKRRLIDRVRTELKIKREINNATLVQFETYESGEKELSALYLRCGREESRLLETLRILAEQATDEKKLTLAQIEKTDCLK